MRNFSGARARDMAARLRSVRVGSCLVVLFGVFAACGSEEAPAIDVSRLERAALARRGTLPGVGAAETWARAAERSGDGLGALQARQLLEEATEVPRLMCAANLSLARLEAEPRARYLAAYRALRQGCSEARALLTELAAYRPPAGELAAIDRALGLTAESDCRLLRLATFGAGASGVRAVAYLEGTCPMELPAQATGRFEARIEGLDGDSSVPRSFEVEQGGLRQLAWSAEGLVAELAPGAQVHAYQLPDRLILDVSTERSLDEAAAERALTLVIDPGHGGVEHGAIFEELEEADLVLDIGLRVERILRRRLPASRVVLTRRQDEQVSLEQRTALANTVDADVFVSIHLNAADEPVSKGGVTTFVLDVSSDAQAIRLAARENGTRPAQVSGIQRLIARLHRREQVPRSRRLAALVHEETLAAGRREFPGLADRGVRSALFYVLVGARMPAVLLEASFLTKPEDAAELRRPAYREALAAGIAQGIVRYVAEPVEEP